MHEAIILAGGFGTRLRAVVPKWPKPMAPVAGKPFLEHLLVCLSKKKFSRIILSLGFMAHKISSYFGNHFAGMELCYVLEDQPLGTGGAVRLALPLCKQGHVFIFNGDTFLDLEADRINAQWLERRHPIIVARLMPDTSRYGRLQVRNGLVKGFTEKELAGPGLINAGCYVFDRTQLDAFALNQSFSLEADFLTNAIQTMPVDVFVTNGYFIDIGVPADYRRAQTKLARL